MERVPCEFLLIRYVPDAVKGEFVNVGVVLREVGGGASGGVSDGTNDSGGRALVRFTRDWARVRCMDAEADVEMLEGLEQEIARRLGTGDQAVLATFEDSLSNTVQISSPRACLAETVPAELDQLMRLYVEPVKVPRVRVKSGRAAIAAAMRTEFERGLVWGAMAKRISAARYTAAGDPLKIDCGYKAGAGERELVRMFHAVSLANDVEAAKGLAFTAPDLREGVRRVEGTAMELTAVVESLRTVSEVDGVGEDEAGERYRFGVETMERQAIRVVTVADLARVAETARRELGF